MDLIREEWKKGEAGLSKGAKKGRRRQKYSEWRQRNEEWKEEGAIKQGKAANR